MSLILCSFFVYKIAQQEAQRAQYIVEKAKQERQQKVVQAEGEAAAAKMVGKNSQKASKYYCSYLMS